MIILAILLFRGLVSAIVPVIQCSCKGHSSNRNTCSRAASALKGMAWKVKDSDIA